MFMHRNHPSMAKLMVSATCACMTADNALGTSKEKVSNFAKNFAKDANKIYDANFMEKNRLNANINTLKKKIEREEAKPGFRWNKIDLKELIKTEYVFALSDDEIMKFNGGEKRLQMSRVHVLHSPDMKFYLASTNMHIIKASGVISKRSSIMAQQTKEYECFIDFSNYPEDVESYCICMQGAQTMGFCSHVGCAIKKISNEISNETDTIGQKSRANLSTVTNIIDTD